MAHIITQSLSDEIERGSKAVQGEVVLFLKNIPCHELRRNPFHFLGFGWARMASAIIEHLGGYTVRDLLGFEDFHNPRNVMLLTAMAHELFDELDIWLVPFEVGLISRPSVCYRLPTVTQLQDHGNVTTNRC